MFIWVSDKIRYDQSSIERVVGLPLLQNRKGPTLKRYPNDTLRKVCTRCRHCKTDRGPPYFRMSLRHVQILPVTHIFVAFWNMSQNSSMNRAAFFVSITCRFHAHQTKTLVFAVFPHATIWYIWFVWAQGLQNSGPCATLVKTDTFNFWGQFFVPLLFGTQDGARCQQMPKLPVKHTFCVRDTATKLLY